MTIWLLGTSATQSSSVGFGPLPGDSQWTPVAACVTATRPHADIRVQFYDDPKTMTLGIDAVDVHRSLATNGGFDIGDGGSWRTERATRFAIYRSGRLSTSAYEGNGYGAVSTSVAGGGIYQDISFPITAGESFCADAEVVTAGVGAQARGGMTIWLLGTSATQSSSVRFGPLPGDSRWTHISACVTATRPHAYVRIQFYDEPRTLTLGIDAVDVR
jgi:hypothetical protein